MCSRCCCMPAISTRRPRQVNALPAFVTPSAVIFDRQLAATLHVVLPAGLVGGRAALISIGRLPEVAPLSLHRCLKLQTSLAQS